VGGLAPGPAGANGRTVPLTITEYRFDATHNSYFELARRLREETLGGEGALSPEDRRELRDATELLESAERASRLDGLRRVAKLGRPAKALGSTVASLANEGEDEEIRREAFGALLALNAPHAYPAEVVCEVERLSGLSGIRSVVEDAASLSPTVRLRANAACFIVVEEEKH
jgi:hypothetical protein